MIMENHSKILLDTLYFLHQQNVFTDICLKCQGVTMSAHRAVLVSYSELFKALLLSPNVQTEQPEIELDSYGMTVETLRMALECMYTGGIPDSVVNKADLLQVARKFGMSTVVKSLEATISNASENTTLPLTHEEQVDDSLQQHQSHLSDPSQLGTEEIVTLPVPDLPTQEKNDNLPPTTNAIDKCHKCPHCLKAFKRKSNLARHLKSSACTFSKDKTASKLKKSSSTKAATNEKKHSNASVYKCWECEASFTSASEQRSHIQSVHHGGESLPCKATGCFYTAPTTRALQIHMRRKHPGDGPSKFLCETCGKSFTRQRYLQSHVEIQHGGNPTLYPCKLCDFKTPHRQSVAVHLAHSHGVSEDGEAVKKALQCDRCDYTCFTKHMLKVHTMRHEGNLPYKCKHCDYATNLKDSLSKHMRKHLQAKSFQCHECGKRYNSQSGYRAHMLKHRGMRPYKCSDCDKEFITKASLIRHKFTHINQLPYGCDRCSFECTVRENLASHLLTVHGVRGHNLKPRMELLGHTDIKRRVYVKLDKETSEQRKLRQTSDQKGEEALKGEEADSVSADTEMQDRTVIIAEAAKMANIEIPSLPVSETKSDAGVLVAHMKSLHVDTPPDPKHASGSQACVQQDVPTNAPQLFRAVVDSNPLGSVLPAVGQTPQPENRLVAMQAGSLTGLVSAPADLSGTTQHTINMVTGMAATDDPHGQMPHIVCVSQRGSMVEVDIVRLDIQTGNSQPLRPLHGE